MIASIHSPPGGVGVLDINVTVMDNLSIIKKSYGALKYFLPRDNIFGLQISKTVCI